MNPAPDIDRLFLMLADPFRRGLVERLARGPASVSELAAPAGVGLPAVLKHLNLLEDSGIVVSQKTGRVRTFRMQDGALAPVSGWIADRQAAMNAAFDRLAAAMADTPEERDH